jgi:histidine triad (HIT) family protein
VAADCLFCRIVSGDLDSDVVAETDRVLAFRDINPGAPTHVLVVPKKHINSIRDLTREHDELLGEIFALVEEIATKEELKGGHRVVTNVGPDAGQSVHHLHFHLLGGRTMAWPPG